MKREILLDAREIEKVESKERKLKSEKVKTNRRTLGRGVWRETKIRTIRDGRSKRLDEMMQKS